MTSAKQWKAGYPLVAAIVALGCALCLVVARPSTAAADDLSDLSAIQQEIQEHNADYKEAQEQVDELQAQIDENQARIDELEAELPEVREQAAASMRTLYKMQQGSGGLVDLLLSADTFYDLLSTVQYLDIIQASNTDAINELLALEDELELARASLNSQMQEAEERREEAEDALDEAKAARDELEAKIAAQQAAEEAARKAAIEAAKKEDGKTFTTESGGSATVETPSNDNGPGSVSPGSDKDAFVSEWAPRIDAYLAGSPLSGQGKTFAEAAFEYNVDPRFSPAISMVESTQGRYCFKPHNAWGWGSSSWSSWEEAIWAHVQGLSIGYGGRLTVAGAKKYCPPNWQYWYSTVASEMSKI